MAVPLTVTSVASAAIISGDLIIGLSDGSIINCGQVQGPQGLDGPEGPIGAPGRPGLDGNTILTSEGSPRADVGKNGDYIIDKTSWTIYGPKANGVWGIGTPLRGKGNGSGDTEMGRGVPTSQGSGSDGGRAYTTGNLPLTGTGREGRISINPEPGEIIPGGSNLIVQANVNGWYHECLRALDESIPVSIGDVFPDGKYNGDLHLKDGELYIYIGGSWEPISSDAGPPVHVGENAPDGTPQTGELWFCTEPSDLTMYVFDGVEWVPASPPVSLDGIESSIYDLSKEISEVNNRITSVSLELDQEVAYKNGDRADNFFEGQNEFAQPLRVAAGTEGNEAITYEQLANLAGEIEEIKDEKEKGEWIAEVPGTGSEGGREILVNAEGFPEAQGGSNMMQLKESGGPDGFGQLSILIDPGYQDDENKALQRWLKDAAEECTADPDAFRDKYSFFCPQAEELGFAVRDQPIYAIEDPSLTTFKVKFYGKPDTGEKEESIIGVEFFQEGAEGHRPAKGLFFMEAYQDKSTQEQICSDEYTNCLTGDPTNDSKCLRDLDACMDNAADGFKPVSDFGEATAVIFHKTDAKVPSVTHSFDEVRIGDSLSITDRKTGHFVVAEIDVIQQVGDHIRFTIDTISHSGGIVDGNKCSVEFYDFSLTPGGPDLDQYVKKTGDTMTGPMKIESDENVTDVSLLIKAGSNHIEKNNILEVRTNKDDRAFWVDGKNIGMRRGFMPTEDNHAVNKKYVDNKVAEIEKEEDETNARLYGSPYIFRQDKSPEDLASGEFTYDKDANWYAHRYDSAGDRIGISSEDYFTHDGMFKVYKHNGAINLICIMHRFDVCKTGQKGNDHFKWQKKAQIYTHFDWLVDGNTFYLSDGFLLP